MFVTLVIITHRGIGIHTTDLLKANKDITFSCSDSCGSVGSESSTPNRDNARCAEAPGASFI